MFFAPLAAPSLWQPVIRDEILLQSLSWLENEAEIAHLGDYPLGEPGWYANVHTYDTLPEVDCSWENHQHTIDIQYMISGSEGIRWNHVDELGPEHRYIKSSDRQEFQSSQASSSLLFMQPGRFVIFMPGDAHCPKIALQEQATLRKAVVKIPFHLLSKA